MSPQKLWLSLAATIILVPLVIAGLSWRSILILKDSIGANSSNFEAAALDEGKQKQIWDNEHITFEIEKRLGQAFLNAMLDKDSDRLKSLFREGAQCQQLTQNEAQVRKKKRFTESRIDAGSALTTTVKSSDLAESLESIANRFSSVDQKKFRVLKIKQLS